MKQYVADYEIRQLLHIHFTHCTDVLLVAVTVLRLAGETGRLKPSFK